MSGRTCGDLSPELACGHIRLGRLACELPVGHEGSHQVSNGSAPPTIWVHREAPAAVAARPAGQDEDLHEWQCPSCGATTRARMADQPSPVTDQAREEIADALAVELDILGISGEMSCRASEYLAAVLATPTLRRLLNSALDGA